MNLDIKKIKLLYFLGKQHLKILAPLKIEIRMFKNKLLKNLFQLKKALIKHNKFHNKNKSNYHLIKLKRL